MFTYIKNRFKSTPLLYYAFSIGATWANAGSILNGISISKGDGLIPFLLWAVGNTLACIVFGVFAPMIPRLRDVFRSRAMKIIMGIMCPFQCWVSLNGIQTVFADSLLGQRFGIILALAIAVFFVFLLFRFGMIRNVLTDHVSWILVYGLIFVTTVIALYGTKITAPALGADHIAVGVKNCLLLIPGAFMYPYYYELLDYNDKNSDGTAKVSIRKAFVVGGLAFGAYLFFVFAMSLADFGPVLGVLKAILVTLVAASSLSSFLYSAYLSFGRKLGMCVNLLTVGLWQFLIPLGVMGAWTLMASIRIYIVAGAVLASLMWAAFDRKAVSA